MLKEVCVDPAPDSKRLEGLQLNLGLPDWLVMPVVGFENTWAKTIVSLVVFLMTPIEVALCTLIGLIPDQLMNKIIVVAWRVLVLLFSLLPRCIRNRGIAEEMSVEAHLYSIFMFGARLVPISLARLRFGMTGLRWGNPAPADMKIEEINHPELGVSGVWLHTAPPDAVDPPVLLWYFGGAFFAGDVMDNVGIAKRYAESIGADVFLARYRLLPEHSLEEAMQDGARSYEWLLSKKDASKIIALGISAGAGLLLHTLQMAKSTDPEERKWAFNGNGPTPQPRAAVFLGPCCDLTLAASSDVSMIKHSAVDLVVSQRVIEYCMYQCLELHSLERLERLSPLQKDMEGLCPILTCYSMHEAVTDECEALVGKLKAAGNQGHVSKINYMPHVFQFLNAFLPEARAEELRTLTWMQKVMRL